MTKEEESKTIIPSSASTSKIVWTAIVGALVNLLVSLGVIPQELGDATIEVVNVVVFAIIAYLRIFRTISPNALSYLRTLLRR